MHIQARRPIIALLIGWEIEPDMLIACALSAASLHADFYYFYPSGVDETRRMIRGFRFEYAVWVEDEFPYPDIVYDRMRRREVDGFNEVYRKLERVLFTHTLKGRLGSKSVIYNWMRQDDQLKRHLIPFQTLRNETDGLAFIYKHQAVVLKADKGASGQGILIVQVKEDYFEVLDQQYTHRMNEAEVLELLKMLIPKHYCLQRMIESVTSHGFPFHIRVHVTKDGSGQWVVGFCAPAISLDPNVKVTNSEHSFRVTPTWKVFLKQHLNEQPGSEIDLHIQRYAIQLAQFLEEKVDGSFHEMGLDIGLDAEGRIWMFEAGIGIPTAVFHMVEIALPAMAYSLYMLDQARNQGTVDHE